MTLIVKVDGVALPDGALVIAGPNNSLPGGVQGLPLAAWYGEALTGGYVIDDPDGDFDFTGLHTITAEETAATRPFITGGWITGRRVERGPYKSGPGRIHHVDFIDINWNFALMVFRASSAKRPAETDIARFAFIQASAPMAFTPSIDNGRFNVTDNPVNFDDSDLVGRYPIEGINEFAGISGKNFYNYWDNDTEEISLHYDLVGVGPAASMAVSNDMADAGAAVYYPYLDAELDQGPAWKVTGMLLGYRGAYAYGIRQATIDDLSPSIFSPSEFQRDEVYRTDRIGRLETANAQIVSMLDDRAEDIETIRVTVELPAANVNDAYPGEILPVTFTHLPGYETEVELPIIRRNVVPKDGRTDTYLVHFELSGAALPSGPGGGDPGDFPNQPCAPTLVDFWAEAVDGAPSGTLWYDPPSTEILPQPGDMIVVVFSARGGSGPDAHDVPGISEDWTALSTLDTEIRAWAKISDGTETGIVVDGASSGTGGNEFGVWFLRGADLGSLELEITGATSDTPSAVITPSYASGIAMAWTIGLDDNTPGQTDIDFTPDAGWTQDYQRSNSFAPEVMAMHQDFTDVPVTASSVATRFSGSPVDPWKVLVITAAGSEDGCCPDAGQWVEEETVTLTGADGMTRCPFADGSLHVFIDNVEQTGTLVSQDGETGEFTLGFDPTPTEVCTVSYQGR